MWYSSKKLPGKILGNKYEFAVEMLGEYYDDQLKQVNKDYLDKCKANNC